ncbi:hypothetical protein ACYFX5_24590 [Bremerella sp. T1]|nr:hypothetical protein [Bremerella volcania]
MKKLGSLLVLVALTTFLVGCAPKGDPSTTNPNSNDTAPTNTTH